MYAPPAPAAKVQAAVKASKQRRCGTQAAACHYLLSAAPGWGLAAGAVVTSVSAGGAVSLGLTNLALRPERFTPRPFDLRGRREQVKR